MLSVELTDGLKQHADGAIVDDVIQGAIEVGRILTPGLFRLGLGIVPGGELMGSEIGKLIESYGKARFSAYTEARDSVKSFRKNLKALAKKVSEEHDNNPALIMIDELDRCRPSYAVELLEVAKHLFSVDRIIFVLAVNRAELSHSVKALYGQDFDANGYLKRFIDIDFLLPTPNRDHFIADVLDRTNIDHYFKRTKDPEAVRGGKQFIETLLCSNFQTNTISLRQISQAIHRIGLVLASLPDNKKALLWATAVAVIVRTMDEDLYHRFRMGKATDMEVVDKIFPGKENSIQLKELQRRQCEIAIMLGYQELSGQPSPLLQRYLDLKTSEDPENDASRVYREHVELVVDQMDRVRQAFDFRGAGFRFAISRIELFSDELKGEPDSAIGTQS